MKFRSYTNSSILGLIGAIIVLLSEFFPWFGEYNLIELYRITTSVAIKDSFLYLFPLISGVICLIASIMIFYKEELRIQSVIITIMGLGFLLLFLFEYISQEIEYLPKAQVGLYLGITGFLLIFFNLINILLMLIFI